MGRIDNRFTQVGEAVANVSSSETLSAVDKVNLLAAAFML
jgi:hypothetical protein